MGPLSCWNFLWLFPKEKSVEFCWFCYRLSLPLYWNDIKLGEVCMELLSMAWRKTLQRGRAGLVRSLSLIFFHKIIILGFLGSENFSFSESAEMLYAFYAAWLSEGPVRTLSPPVSVQTPLSENVQSHMLSMCDLSNAIQFFQTLLLLPQPFLNLEESVVESLDSKNEFHAPFWSWWSNLP